MKISYNVYAVNSSVYGVSRIYKDGKPTDSVTIYEATVDGVSINYNEKTNGVEISYMLRTPKGDLWGDSVEEIEVSDSFDEIAYRMKEEWSKNSNFNG